MLLFSGFEITLSPSFSSHFSIICFEDCYFNYGKERQHNSSAVMPVVPLEVLVKFAVLVRYLSEEA